MEWKDTETRMPGGELLGAGRADGADTRAFVAFFVSTGFVNAAIAALLLSRLPQPHVPSAWALLARAALYVLVGAAAGVAGAYFYWSRSANPYRLSVPISFGSFSLICARGWVWVPAALLLSTQDSKATAFIGLVCGAILGAGLRRALTARDLPGEQPGPTRVNEMFAATLEPAPIELRGYLIAGFLYAAGYVQQDGARLMAALLCAVAAFLFMWHWKTPVQVPGNSVMEGELRREARWRLLRSGGFATLITAWALMLGAAHRAGHGDAALAADTADPGSQKAHSGTRGESNVGSGGFESVILWPLPQKKQIIPPIPAPPNLLGLEKSRPLVIRFDGVYWYFQPPDQRPGRAAHQAHGTPLSVNIQANNFLPLVMEAHQRLIGPVRLSRCGEIDVEIQNRDNLRGELSLGLMLGDSSLPNHPTLYLGKKEIEGSLPGFFNYKTAPVFETLRFAIPPSGPIRKFDEITVLLLPEIEHSMVGPRIAIEQFELQPR